jgi:uncharacterized protein YkwD
MRGRVGLEEMISPCAVLPMNPACSTQTPSPHVVTSCHPQAGDGYCTGAQACARTVVYDLWKNSPEHLANILGDFMHFGMTGAQDSAGE